jgi:hypothetical protein
MAIERALTPFLPFDAEEQDISVEVLLPDEDGEYVEEVEEEQNLPFDANLAEGMDEATLQALSSTLISGYDADRNSRSDWEKTYVKGLDLLGLRFEERTKPWDGASGVFHPLLTEAVVRFQSQTIQEVFPAKGPAKTTITGKETPDILRQAVRVANYLNYTATVTMAEYRNETEKLLFTLPIAGSAFRKVYFDPAKGRPCAMFVPPEDLVVSYGASDLASAPRATHVMKRTPNELRKAQVSGFYVDVELDDPQPNPDDVSKKLAKLTGEEEKYSFDGRYTLLEMQVEIDLAGFEHTDDGDEPTGIMLPYVVTIEKSSGTILGIRRNWDEEDPHTSPIQHYVHYQYLPGLGFYGFGLVHMIGGLAKSATSLLRQLIDSGTLSNLPGGLKARGLKIKGDNSPIRPGEFRDVDVPAGSIKDNISWLPYKEPSSVLYQLLGDLVQEGRRFASAADVKAADINAEAPVGTTLAVLEREMKVMSAIQARVHHAMGSELKMISTLVKDYGPEKYPYATDEEYTVEADFDDRVDVIPVSDPNAGTMAQRIMQYQAALQLSASKPDLYDEALLHRQMLEVLGIQEADRIIPTEDDMKPVDPVTENMAILNGKPVKAFLYQDHEAHIETHLSAKDNPDILKIIEQSPNAKVIAAAMAAHITEHVAYAYRARVEKELGVALPSPDEPLPEDIELRLSRLVSEASAQVTGKAQRLAKAERDAAAQEDPIVQQGEKELEIKQEAIAAKDADSMRKAALENRKIDVNERLKTAELAVEIIKSEIEREDANKVKGFEIGMQLANDMVDDNKVNQSDE